MLKIHFCNLYILELKIIKKYKLIEFCSTALLLFLKVKVIPKYLISCDKKQNKLLIKHVFY